MIYVGKDWRWAFLLVSIVMTISFWFTNTGPYRATHMATITPNHRIRNSRYIGT